MAREKELFRTNLQLLLEFFPGKRLLRPFEVAKYLGIDVRTVKKKYKFDDDNYISTTVLASQLS